MKALSEKLKLFQTIDQDKEAIIKQLRDSESARLELSQQLEENAKKSSVENDKLHQYQEILLKEND